MIKKLAIALCFVCIAGISANAESLFSLNATQSSFIEPRPLYSSVRARNVGDLVTIVIDEVPTLTDSGVYETEKTSSILENLTGALNTIFKTNLKGALNGTNGTISVSGSTNTQRSLGIQDKVAVQVIQLLPNGNLLVQGKKTLVNANERVDLLVSGIVDPRWIDQQGEISSNQVANLQFAMSGAGTVSRGQNEGILYRFMRYIF
ncbi:TPA: flagellar basal body L-ring protein FlgH [Candidatus Galligastranaerophilus intestinavium]|uniref:Flagellar basal body L-ring protein FlgH n=1 Tax=Candidatus Galligastranaerophilus intestinavium TaxID=2840836 RepID=A0A9D1JYJ9_9BACT|nr:flagellar basal body L-ring protein FlgH [Candidatus Galligastranaerophilus intestinavium]